jgi:hypothetical protein
MIRRRFQDDCVAGAKWFRGAGELFRPELQPGETAALPPYGSRQNLKKLPDYNMLLVRSGAGRLTSK